MENIKKSYKNNKFKISTPRWNDKFELSDGSHSASGIQDYFEYIMKNYGPVTDNPPIRTYINETANIIKFIIKTGYYLKLLMAQTMK